MLVITRRIGECFTLSPHHDLDPTMTVKDLFTRGTIEIHVLGVRGHQVRVGIDAPSGIRVLRSELDPGEPAGSSCLNW